MTHRKIISFDQIKAERKFASEIATFGLQEKFIFTNGCFDLFHAGHAALLDSMKAICGLRSKLIVGINSDKSVRALKGSERPIIPQEQRAYVVACHEAVDYVFIFNEKTVQKQLRELEPDFWLKGGDYDINSLNKKEVNASPYTKIQMIPFIDGISATNIIKKIKL